MYLNLYNWGSDAFLLHGGGRGEGLHLLNHGLPLLRRLSPGKILRDALLGHGRVGFRGVDLHRADHRCGNSRRVLLGELIRVQATYVKPCDTFLHCVHKPPSRGHDWNRPVLHRLKLNKSAWLKPARNGHEVSASKDVVGERKRKLHNTLDLVWEVDVKVLDELLELLLSGSQDNNLAVAPLENFWDCGKEDVDSLLLLQSPNEADHRNGWVDLETHFRLKCRLCRGLPLHNTVGPKLHRKVLVLERVEIRVIHSVHDSFDATALRDDLVELHAFLRVSDNFLCVVWTHGDVLIGGHESGLQPVKLWIHLAELRHLLGVLDFVGWRDLAEDLVVSVLKLELCPGGLWELQGFPGLWPEPPLEGDVVNAESDLGVSKLPCWLVHVLDKHGDQSRVPVVGDKGDVLPVGERQGPGGLDGGLAEDAEPLLVVDKVGTRLLPVQLASSLPVHLGEEARVVDEDSVDALLLRVEESHLFSEHVYDDGGVPRVRVLVVSRRDGHDPVSSLRQLDRQTSHHVAQASGLTPRGNLSRHENNVQGCGRNLGKLRNNRIGPGPGAGSGHHALDSVLSLAHSHLHVVPA
mmetsp:Transcript_5645/g.10287  ORF Transcript_5645/g.10287 Transcript_5645/m.10287 type:complete len:578 (+) Transcript_5645:41-1774(+)